MKETFAGDSHRAQCGKAFRLISEGSRDTEDWSNDAENPALYHMNISHFTIYSNRKAILNCNNISQYYSFYCIFSQINAALVSRRDFFEKHKKNSTDLKLFNV